MIASLREMSGKVVELLLLTTNNIMFQIETLQEIAASKEVFVNWVSFSNSNILDNLIKTTNGFEVAYKTRHINSMILNKINTRERDASVLA